MTQYLVIWFRRVEVLANHWKAIAFITRMIMIIMITIIITMMIIIMMKMMMIIIIIVIFFRNVFNALTSSTR